MDQYALFIFLFKTFIVITGLLIIFMGYRLFVKGIFNEAGDIKATWADRGLLIKKAAPGAFFALFGACIIAITTYKGLQFDNTVNKTPIVFNQSTTEPPPLKDSVKLN